MLESLIALGKTDVQITPLGTGAWSWGDKLFWQFGKGYAGADVQDAFDATLAGGINFFDTAELYGQGESEKFLGRFVRASKQNLIIATKCFPMPWRWSSATLIGALRASLKRLGMERVDLYQMHQPFPPVAIEDWMSAMADANEAGLIRAIGVSNYNADQTRRASDALAKRNRVLAANQVKYSLLDRRIERNGVMQACRERGITIIAYSPIEMGMLSGKYSPQNPPPGLRAFRYSRERLARMQSLVECLREIAKARGKTLSQVAINWAMCKGTVPIPGAKNARQATENAGALGWRLNDSEIAALDDSSDRANAYEKN
jgi:aryl-alcohol dehydrogenase-like predicted oxidoreductase